MQWVFYSTEQINFTKNYLMLLAELLTLAYGFIYTKEKHQWYDRVNDLRTKYKALMTGEDMDKLLIQFVRREDLELFEQRVQLTIAITPAVCGSVMKPFNKVARNNKVKIKFDFNDDNANNNVQDMVDAFYGRQRSKNKGIDYWLKTRFPQLSFCDPNAFVVVEWDTPETATVITKPRPFEVSSQDAWNFKIISEELNWLWVHNCISYMVLDKGKNEGIKAARARNIGIPTPGHQFTMYDQDQTLVFEQVDPNYLKANGYVYADNETLWEDVLNKDFYLVKTFNPNLGYVPAIRVGYIKDIYTDAVTFVNPFHDAMPYLMKSIKTVSEMDLTMALHAFPQKLQYVQRCPGENKKKCNAGYIADGMKCSLCGGKGYSIHTTAQDAFLLPIPDDKTDMMDIDKLIAYKSPPIDLVQFQKSYIDSLKADAHYAVFTQQTLTRTVGPSTKGPGGGAGNVTATETNTNMQSVYDALHPFTEKESDTWVEFVTIFADLAGADTEDAVILHKFPADFKLKSIEDLLNDLTAINASGAPSFLRDQANCDIAEVLYEGDDLEMLRFQVRHKFFPFNGQSPDEIALNMASGYVSEYTKVLYANYEAIFSEIELEKPNFYLMPLFADQVAIVEAKVAEYIEEIQTNQQIRLNVQMGAVPPDGDNIVPLPDGSGNEEDNTETPEGTLPQSGDPGENSNPQNANNA